jgi:hypothetical protein
MRDTTRKDILEFLAQVEEHHPDEASNPAFVCSMMIFNAFRIIRDGEREDLSPESLMQYAYATYCACCATQEMMLERTVEKEAHGFAGLLRDLGFDVRIVREEDEDAD